MPDDVKWNIFKRLSWREYIIYLSLRDKTSNHGNGQESDFRMAESIYNRIRQNAISVTMQTTLQITWLLILIKSVLPTDRVTVIAKWAHGENYRGHVEGIILGMIEWCDDTMKAIWLSKLFKVLVLECNYSR